MIHRLSEPTDDALVLVLSAIANHDNMGGLFRNAAAFGVDLVVLDEACCDPLYRKAIRVSAGAALAVPFVRAGTVDVIADALASHGFAVLATSPRGVREVDELAPGGRLALIFGAEGAGLPPALLERLATVRIGMAGGMDSLNVATSSGILLHRLRKRLA